MYHSIWLPAQLLSPACLRYLSHTFANFEPLHDLNGKDRSHDLSQAGNFPLSPLPKSNMLILIAVIQTPTGATDI